MDHRDLIHAYFRCFAEKDRARLEELLVPGFVHTSPFGVFTDRDRMLDAIWPGVEAGGRVATGLEIFGDGPEYAVRYHHEGDVTRIVEMFRFDGDRIAEVEVFLGRGAPFPSA